MAEESNLKKRMISIINKHIESNPMTNENKKPKKEGEEEWIRAFQSQCKEGEHPLGFDLTRLTLSCNDLLC